MCKSSSDCAKCEYHGDKCNNVIDFLEKTVAAVEQWSKEHPRKTRQSVFLKRWPNAAVYGDGVLGLSPIACEEARKIEDGLSKHDYSIARMVELMQADKDGRLMVLPEGAEVE